jgi:peptidoglycan/xylan/chitin deacetylase (PgdA/CDA1 family)
MSRLRAALTFDAEHPSRELCPPGNEDRILDALAGAGARATFFLQGRWATAHPDAARRIARDGHLVGNHSNHHAPMPLLTDEGIEADVRGSEERIRAVTGADPRPWFRCPFGLGADDPRVVAGLAALGYRNVGWNVTASDWEGDRTGPDIERDVVAGVRSHGDGAIVLLHSWPGPTSEALPGLVASLLEGGFELVAVDEVADGG